MLAKNTKHETHILRKIIIKNISQIKKRLRQDSIQFLKIFVRNWLVKIPNSSKPFEDFVKQVDATVTTHCLSINELKDPFCGVSA